VITIRKFTAKEFAEIALSCVAERPRFFVSKREREFEALGYVFIGMRELPVDDCDCEPLSKPVMRLCVRT
jgi:hypothetical protein